MNVKTRGLVHNKFEFHTEDIVTGEKAVYEAYNILLNSIWTRLCNNQTYFSHINIGRGTGTLDPARTTMFDRITGVSATADSSSYGDEISWTRKRIVFQPEQHVGEIITEVSIAFDSAAGSMVTHAFLADAEGNTISLEKTGTMVLTIYATTFAEVLFDNVDVVPTRASNALRNLLMGAGGAGSSIGYGTGIWPRSKYQFSSSTGRPLTSTSAATTVVDVPNKRRTMTQSRVAVGSGNGPMSEVSFGGEFSAKLPLTGVYAGHPRANVSLGTGDGTETKFRIPSKNVKLSSLVVKEDTVPTVAFTTDNPVEYPSGTNLFTSDAAESATHTTNTHIWVAIWDNGGGSPWKYALYLDHERNIGVIEREHLGAIETQLVTGPFPSDANVNRGSFKIDGDYLAVATTGGGFKWWKIALTLGVVSLTELPVPASMPTAKQNRIDFEGGYLFVVNCTGGTTYDGIMKWYKVIADELVEQTAPATAPGINTVAPLILGDHVYTFSTWYGVGSRYLIELDGLDYVLTYIGAVSIPSDTSEYFYGITKNGQANEFLHTDYRNYNPRYTLFTWDAVTGDVTSRGTVDRWYTNNWGFIGPRLLGNVYDYSNPSNGYAQVRVYSEDWSANTLYVMSANVGGNTGGSACDGRDGVGIMGGTGILGRRIFAMTLEKNTDVIFDTAPAIGVAVTANYTVDGIDKSTNWFIDATWTLEFGEPAP